MFIYTYRPVLPPALVREASFLQQMVINAETHNQGDESDCWMPSSKQDTGVTPKFREHCRRDLKNLRAGQKGGL